MILGAYASSLLFLLLWNLMSRNHSQLPIIVLRTISLGRWWLDLSLLLLSLILHLVGKRMLRRSGLLMALIPLLGVFLLTIGVLLVGLGVGLLGRLILSGRRDIGSVRAESVWTGMTGGCHWVFLLVGMLGILLGSTTLLLIGDAVSVASKFFLLLYMLIGSFTNISY